MMWCVWFALQAAVVADQNAKLSIFATRPAIYSPAYNFITEVMGTVALLLLVLLIEMQARLSAAAAAAAAAAVVATVLAAVHARVQQLSQAINSLNCATSSLLVACLCFF
jgi:glycerol uptake facilitator-like aquaporin